MSASEKTPLLATINGVEVHIVDIVYKEPYEYEPLYYEDFSSYLTLEELLIYKDDPWWINIRRILFCSFWLTVLLTLFTACILSYLQFDIGSCSVVQKSSAALDSAAATNIAP